MMGEFCRLSVSANAERDAVSTWALRNHSSAWPCCRAGEEPEQEQGDGARKLDACSVEAPTRPHRHRTHWYSEM